MSTDCPSIPCTPINIAEDSATAANWQSGGGGHWEYYLLQYFPNLPPMVSPRRDAAYQYTCDGTTPVQGICPAAPSVADAFKNVGNSCASAGNPINIGFPNKYQIDTDYSGASGLELRRYYNSYRLLSLGDGFGTSWRHTFSRSVRLESITSLSTARVSRPSGKVYVFNFVASAWTPDADISDRLVRLTNTSGVPTGWQYTNADDEIELYDINGKLLSVMNRAGITQTLTYSDGSTPSNVAPTSGLLIRVSDSFGRQLNFTYDNNSRINTIMDPTGQVYSYAYDASNNLASVTYPDNTPANSADNPKRIYLYNEQAFTANTNLPHALTGSTDENGARFATWNYDTSGRAISSEHAGGVEKVSLTYNADGTTTVSDYKDSATIANTSRTYSFQTILGVAKTYWHESAVQQRLRGECGSGNEL
jgi:YD repeat-containing protein